MIFIYDDSFQKKKKPFAHLLPLDTFKLISIFQILFGLYYLYL